MALYAWQGVFRDERKRLHKTMTRRSTTGGKARNLRREKPKSGISPKGLGRRVSPAASKQSACLPVNFEAVSNVAAIQAEIGLPVFDFTHLLSLVHGDCARANFSGL